jgi:hypothetical protein
MSENLHDWSRADHEYSLARIYGRERDQQISEIKSWAKEGWRLVAATDEWLYFERPIPKAR